MGEGLSWGKRKENVAGSEEVRKRTDSGTR